MMLTKSQPGLVNPHRHMHAEACQAPGKVACRFMRDVIKSDHRTCRNSLVGAMKPPLPTTGSRITPATCDEGQCNRICHCDVDAMNVDAAMQGHTGTECDLTAPWASAQVSGSEHL